MGHQSSHSKISPMSDEEFRQRVNHAGRISSTTLKVTIAVMTGIAVFCFAGRLVVRITTRRRLFLDDAFLTLAVGCLVACVSIIYKHYFAFYLANAIAYAPEVALSASFARYHDVLQGGRTHRNALAALSWTTIYAVKFCFFAFFRSLILHLKWLYRYYWFCIAFSFLSWLFSAFKLFALPNLKAETPNLVFTIVMAVLDSLTDIMVVSIPIVLLRKSTMKLSTKLSILFFLSLSIFMIICSIIRASRVVGVHHSVPDTSWRTLWTQIECSVAIIMGSIMAMRTLFVGTLLQNQNRHYTERNAPPKDQPVSESPNPTRQTSAGPGLSSPYTTHARCLSEEFALPDACSPIGTFKSNG